MARSKSARRRTAPAASVGSDGDTAVADGTVFDGDVDMADDTVIARPGGNIVGDDGDGSVAIADAIDLDPIDRSLLEGVESDTGADDANADGAKDVSAVASNDSAVGTDSTAGTDTSFQSASTEPVEVDSPDGTLGTIAIGPVSICIDGLFYPILDTSRSEADTTVSSTASAVPTPDMYESVSLISDSVGRTIKDESSNGSVVDSVMVSIS